MKVKTILSACCLVALAAIPACTHLILGCPGHFYWSHHTLHFQILDRHTGENFFESYPAIRYDSLMVYDTLWQDVHAGRDDWKRFGGLSLDFIDTQADRRVFTPIHRRFFLYFDHHDSDTIDVTFEFYNDDCDDQRLKYFTVAYDDSIYFDDYTDQVYPVYFLK